MLDAATAAQARDVVGFDISRPITQDTVDIASTVLGSAPAFCGRYFKEPGNAAAEQYQAAHETAIFRRNRLRLLPLGRQTPHVSRPDRALGARDGANNAAAIIASLGAPTLAQHPGVLVFLDVEPDTPLNHIYFEGWSTELVATGARASARINFIPAVYGHHADSVTWRALQQAMAAGAPCEAAWVVFANTPPTFPIGPWRQQFGSPSMPSAVRVTLAQRVLEHEDARRRTYDFNLANPAHSTWLLDRLPAP